MSVIIYEDRAKHRSHSVCHAMLAGIQAVGDHVRLMPEAQYDQPDADVAVFYGLSGKLRNVFHDYPAAGKIAVYADLGYWGRRAGSGIGRFRGYHKLAINSRHPTAYFRKFKHDCSRTTKFGLQIMPWRKGTNVLIASMGAKAAHAEGFAPEAWERKAIDALKKVTDRPVIYRPKPSCPHAAPINGVGYSPPNQPLADVLQNCHAVVTHHSNVAVDSLLAGVPTFCWEGVAAPMSRQDLSEIESPLYPEDRQQWLNDVTWTQFCVDEMQNGMAWRHLKNEGLLP